MSVRHASDLRDRFSALGVSKNLAAALAAEVSAWHFSSGPEWTVNRLKLLKTGFLKRLAGETYHLPYVATRKDALGPVPKGPFGVLWHVDGSDTTSISLALNAMMVYSTFKALHVTPRQWKKFQNSMQREEPLPEKVKEVVEILRIPKWMKVDPSTKLQSLEEFVAQHGISVKSLGRALDHFVESDTGMALWDEFPQYQTCFNTIAKPVDNRIAFDDMFGYHTYPTLESSRDPVGKLGFTQEPGYKLRVFASPNIVHQLAMSRLKAQLFTLLRRVKWDCTYNQSDGTDWLKRTLVQGRKVWSIDLSDATNNFPLEVQLKVLLSIGCSREDVELFHRLSRAPWEANHGDSKTLRWTVGQPLGLGPSFAAFALTHGVLVHSIALKHRVSDAFRVLGDDIVIADEKVATDYLEAMQNMGVPISMDKTIQSNHVAEFAGKVVVRDKILAALKWREPSDRSFLDVVRLLGPRSINLLRKRQKRVATFVSLLPEPEGFGWNPHGIPLSTRLRIAEAFRELTAEGERVFFPLQRRWNKVRRSLEQPYLRLDFTVRWDTPEGKAPEYTSREPTPVGSLTHQLSIAEITGCSIKLPDSMCTPSNLGLLRRKGFITSTLSTDPRGKTPLEDLEIKITKLQPLLEQLALIGLVS